MIFYIGLAILFLFLSVCENRGTFVLKNTHMHFNSRQLIFLLLYAVLLFITVCRSSNVGGDLVNYERAFIIESDVSWRIFRNSFKYDLGYYGFGWLIRQFTADFYIFQSLISIITVTFFMMAVKEQSKCMSLSVFLFICLGSLGGLFSGIRQQLAIVIIFYGIRYLKKKQWIQYFLIVFIASMIHSTAIIGIAAFLFAYEKGTKKGYLKYLILLTAIIFVTLFCIPYFVQMYTKNDYSNLIVSGRGMKLIWFYIGIYVFAMMEYKITTQNNKKNIIYYNFCGLGILIQILSFGFSLLTKLTEYFMIAFIILIPNILFDIKNTRSKTIFFFITIGAFFALYLFYLFQDMSGIVPYEFRWQEQVPYALK